jgi:hypothetical protein
MSDALFEVEFTRRDRGRGPVVTAFRKAIAWAEENGRVADEDGPLIEGAAVLAEALDTAHAVGGLRGGYLAAQSLPAYQKALHALRLPVELTAATPPAGAPGDGQTEAPDWLRDAFGTAE